MSKSKTIWVAVLVGVIALLVRLPEAGSFMTVDEYNWMTRSATLWDEVFRQGDLSGTFQSTHPGTSVMWLAGSGIAWQANRLGFALDQASLRHWQASLRHFRRYATGPIVLMAALLIAGLTMVCIRLFGLLPGSLMGIWLASDPYLIGMNQVVHPDALLGLFMLGALLLYSLYLVEHKENKKDKRVFRLMSGISLGLAMSSKLVPSLWLLPILLGMTVFTQRQSKRWPRWSDGATALLEVVAVAVLVFVLLWPTVFTVPDLQLGYVVRDTVSVLTQEHVALAAAEQSINPVTFYGRTVLGRVTPYTQLLVLAAVVLLVGKGVTTAGRKERQSLRWLVLYVIGFLIVITFASKKADRYALPALAALPLIAGWMAAGLLRWSQKKWQWSNLFLGTIAVGVSLLLLLVPLWWLPHAIAYNNPLFEVRPLSQQGWGEGLELAAQWLNERDQGAALIVASWYPSVMRTYFDGQVVNLSVRNHKNVSYIVTYRNMLGRSPDSEASEVLRELADQEPVHTVMVGGLPYVFIYEAKHEVGNTD
ncbi:hypothetical protein IH781_01485 [Patescibacteria group bacterium]|nr:hypothetical protein [Patescibacteria group bacterium]